MINKINFNGDTMSYNMVTSFKANEYELNIQDLGENNKGINTFTGSIKSLTTKKVFYFYSSESSELPVVFGSRSGQAITCRALLVAATEAAKKLPIGLDKKFISPNRRKQMQVFSGENMIYKCADTGAYLGYLGTTVFVYNPRYANALSTSIAQYTQNNFSMKKEWKATDKITNEIKTLVEYHNAFMEGDEVVVSMADLSKIDMAIVSNDEKSLEEALKEAAQEIFITNEDNNSDFDLDMYLSECIEDESENEIISNNSDFDMYLSECIEDESENEIISNNIEHNEIIPCGLNYAKVILLENKELKTIERFNYETGIDPENF